MNISNTPFTLGAVALLAIAFSGCGGGGTKGTATPAATNVALKYATGSVPTAGSIAGTAPTPAAVVAAANAGSAVIAGTIAGTAGLSVSAPTQISNTTGLLTAMGATTIDPGFKLTPTGSISGGTVTALAIDTFNATTSGRTLSIDNGIGNTFNSAPGSVSAESSMAANSYKAIVASQPFNYTQLGSWAQCSANCVTGIANGVLGYFVQGDATAPANIPTTGTATYSGAVVGTYTDASGNLAVTNASMNSVSNFAARSISFSSSGTTATPVISGIAAAAPTLDLTGTLTYAAGQNLFAGTVNSGAGISTMTGTASGRFNGPAAEEVGGVYNLSGAGGAHIGAFAGQR